MPTSCGGLAVILCCAAGNEETGMVARGDYRLLVGDCREMLRTLPEKSVHCCISSPPYFALRDYGVDGQIGLEPTPEDFIDAMVQVYREVWRVLRDDGTCWINLGDSYAITPVGSFNGGSKIFEGRDLSGHSSSKLDKVKASGLKSGDLMNMPHRVAAALQADGWYWRSTIIWAKRSPMPESVSGWRWVRCRVKLANGAVARWGMSDLKGKSTDKALHALWTACPGCEKCRDTGGYVLRRGRWRPTNAHEYIFLMAKSEKYFCDSDAVQEPTTGGAHHRGEGLNPKAREGVIGREKQNGSFSTACNRLVETRNPRNVWTLSSEPFKGSHFATFPSEIPRRAILASTSAGGCCAACGAQYAPVVDSERVPTRPGISNQIDPTGMPNRDPQRHVAVSKISGYRPTCNCNAGVARCVVLDHFAGSGTTGQVAVHLGRDFIGCELNPEYAAIAEQRINTPWQPKGEKKSKKVRRSPKEVSKPLFV
jgi:DNA modification methylase